MQQALSLRYSDTFHARVWPSTRMSAPREDLKRDMTWWRRKEAPSRRVPKQRNADLPPGRPSQGHFPSRPSPDRHNSASTSPSSTQISRSCFMYVRPRTHQAHCTLSYRHAWPSAHGNPHNAILKTCQQPARLKRPSFQPIRTPAPKRQTRMVKRLQYPAPGRCP